MLRAIDLFSGCGGLSLGLRRAGFLVAAAVELDPRAQETYRLNHPSVRLYGDDIRRLDPRVVLRDLSLKPGELDLLAGCPPCQGFSRLRTKNKRNSVCDARNDLIEDFLLYVAIMKPRSVMLENVPSLAKDARFLRMCADMHALGYNTVADIVDAADYGVAQRRKRLIVLASNVHIPRLASRSSPRVTVREALAGLAGSRAAVDKLHSMKEHRSPKVRRLIEMIPKDGGSRKDLGPQYQLRCHKRTNGFKDVYGRMAWDTVAPTITSGCHNPSKGRFLHPSKNRAITLREAALLQGFPRGYRFNVDHGKESIALMIGNALPPPLIAAHARLLGEDLAKAASAGA